MKNAHGRLLLIRADGGPMIGFGHVMRSLAIAEEWLARGGRCVWATTQPRALEAAGAGGDDVKIVALGTEAGGLEDARATRRLAEECDADWVLADLFAFSPTYFSSAGSRGSKWLIAHDEPLRVNDRINAILNPGPQAAPAFYSGRDPNCGLLLGLAYALVRTELRARSEQTAARRNPPRQVLITFGGSDPDDLTWRTLRALSEGLPDSEVRWRVILGPGYRGACAERGADFQNLSVEFVRYTSNMGGHYAWSDLIVCGASTTLWEAFYFGVPAAVVPAAANQQMVFGALDGCPAAQRFAEPGSELARWMRSAIQGDPATQAWLSKAATAAAKLVDGDGVARVVNYLLPRK